MATLRASIILRKFELTVCPSSFNVLANGTESVCRFGDRIGLLSPLPFSQGWNVAYLVLNLSVTAFHKLWRLTNAVRGDEVATEYQHSLNQ